MVKVGSVVVVNNKTVGQVVAYPGNFKVAVRNLVNGTMTGEAYVVGLGEVELLSKFNLDNLSDREAVRFVETALGFEGVDKYVGKTAHVRGNVFYARYFR